MLSQKAILPDPHTMMAGKPTLRWEWLKKIQNTVSSQAPAANAMAYVTNGMPQFSKSRKRHEHTKSAGTTRYRVRKGSFEHFATTMNSVDARNVPHRRASSKEEEGYERTLVKNSPESMSELRATSSMRNMATNRRTRVPVFCAGRFRRKPLGRLSGTLLRLRMRGLRAIFQRRAPFALGLSRSAHAQCQGRQGDERDEERVRRKGRQQTQEVAEQPGANEPQAQREREFLDGQCGC